MPLNIVLVEPEIPQNTGNIVRTCAVTGCKLHLVKPLGFSIEDKYLKRAGLDYWNLVEVRLYEDLDDFFKINLNGNFYFSTTKGLIKHNDVNYEKDSFILFGKETAGLPKWLLNQNPERCIRIPMICEARSLNLSNSVAIVVYEALRQFDYFGMT
ncbi:MAG: tRNA (uridine(34)/cytosine(34)/5-carboxymethylaminomethyluridine(34)-2'-O)-methyltransferase TrmL [Firmicutes bacterium]|nr:tRNA (uridine(34)/cytosine(34)/5-carboxymethylaminomethyluridine(34)-2'-O)-methyltransferase TrmL [Bacillota bacterium]